MTAAVPDPTVEAHIAEEDTETLRRVVDSAFGTDAVHWQIAAALVAAGWRGPKSVAAEVERAVD